jgi:hypothetical protein
LERVIFSRLDLIFPEDLLESGFGQLALPHDSSRSHSDRLPCDVRDRDNFTPKIAGCEVWVMLEGRYDVFRSFCQGRIDILIDEGRRVFFVFRGQVEIKFA